jgi:predicted 3-demethylubiquinone-9 3-methyltransferase (glyoxalase superfamily)
MLSRLNNIPHLIFESQAEQAVNFYISVFKNAQILHTTFFGKHEPGPEGGISSITFELAGRKLRAINSGSVFNFSQGLSLHVYCDSQQEIDELWNKLSENGEVQEGGWVKDKYGISWQISASEIDNMVNDPDPERSKRVVDAILGMKKLDIELLKEVYDGAA